MRMIRVTSATIAKCEKVKDKHNETIFSLSKEPARKTVKAKVSKA